MLHRPRKVLFAVTEDWYFWSHRKSLADYLQQHDYSVTLATRFNRYKAQLNTAGIQCIPTAFERSLWRPWRDLHAIVQLCSAIRSHRPDVVHLVSLKPILLSGFALLVNRRTRFIAAFTGMGYLFSSTDRRAHFFRRFLVAILRLLLRRSNVWIIVQNAEDHALLQELRLGEPDRTLLIPGVGVDTAVFSYSELVTSAPALVVLPARLIRDKGIEEFVSAAREVKKVEPETRFVLVGANDPDNPAAIRSSVIDGWVREGVIEWWGHHADMASVYHQARIICLPSYREGMPKVLLEAAACGRPLIASDVAGCRDICRNGLNGTLVAPREPQALALAITEMLKDTVTQISYGAAGRKLVEREYSIDNIGQQTLAYYERILASGVKH
jgi:glycosyltransferase involved in cell wall biosynthesis